MDRAIKIMFETDGPQDHPLSPGRSSVSLFVRLCTFFSDYDPTRTRLSRFRKPWKHQTPSGTFRETQPGARWRGLQSAERPLAPLTDDNPRATARTRYSDRSWIAPRRPTVFDRFPPRARRRVRAPRRSDPIVPPLSCAFASC